MNTRSNIYQSRLITISFKLKLSLKKSYLKKETCQFNVQMSKRATSKEASFSCHTMSSESRDVIRWSALSWTCPARLSFRWLRQKALSSAFLCSRARWSSTWCLSFSLSLILSFYVYFRWWTEIDGFETSAES